MTSSDLAAVFDASSSYFAKVTPQVWGPAGQSLVFALRLQPGDTVLDVCCGAGASALPAAAAVGPTGRVHAIDLADDLLEEGRLIASDRALQNIDFVHADVTTWEPPSSVPDAGYAALASSFGVFFLPHMDAAVSRLLRLVRPGGGFGVTVWRSGALDRFAAAYYEVIGRHQANSATGTPVPPTRHVETPKEAAERIDNPEKLAAWLTDLGAASVAVTVLSNLIPATEQFAWDLVLGSGFRAPLDQMNDDTVVAVRSDFLELITDRGIHTVDATALVGTGVITGWRGGED
ncbi:class I SAM-dependent methyltransferase [Antrihabitans cavernicola]|uniref:Methyltransferase domain-containing protein n=1 Tax=Antrihabitans cavernicola TaxID=2495913 RepID=A0A5A7SBV4_9NOCA|nr:methyltransferase domain-containing protein [Spelaeibacter cavernicola]KAA0022317.1 methyltransferase domain-containing protein [Spelaeibacter cavernicola]